MTEYAEFPECGHIPMDEYPQKFVTTLLPFVEKVLRAANSASHADMAGSGSDTKLGDSALTSVLEGMSPAAAMGTQDIQIVSGVTADATH